MLGRVSSAEITQWAAYERVNGPLGARRGDYHAALICTTIANALKGKKGRSKQLSDFLFEWDRGRRRLTDDEMFDKVVALNRQLGGTETGGG
jgi:hypothetical protein